jgi:signal transduction histidine kinase
MKLLRKTLGLYLIVAIPVFFASLGGFFYFLKFVITDQVDEALFQDKERIAEFVSENRNDVTALYKSTSSSYYLREISPDSLISDRYKFVSLFDSVDMDFETARQLRSTIQIKEKKYEIVLQKSFVESDSMIYSIGSFAVFLFVLLTLGISIVQWYISKQIWEPFRTTLRKISAFNPGAKVVPEFETTSIYEFNQLNERLDKMVNRIKMDFEKQKKFIDNVSHELQTPISVISAQVELLIQEMEFQENSAGIIGIIDETLTRMRRLNQVLLLLSKIDNDQFIANGDISINSIIDAYILRQKEQIESNHITYSYNCRDEVLVTMNYTLAEILIQNLLNNAFKHNVDNGFIHVETNARELLISNSGIALEVEPEYLFNKYIHLGSSDLSSGLGLSIVREICNYYRYSVNYTYTDHLHTLRVLFS